MLGQRVRVGDAVLLLVRPCEPCGYLEGLAASPRLRARLLRRGGVRARVLAGERGARGGRARGAAGRGLRAVGGPGSA